METSLICRKMWDGYLYQLGFGILQMDNLAFTAVIWRSPQLSGVQTDNLAFAAVFWRSNR